MVGAAGPLVRAVRAHPLLAALLALAAIRWLILGVLAWTLPVPAGAAVTGWLVNGLYYSAELVVIGAALLALWSLPRVGVPLAIALAVLVLPLALFLSILDPILYRVIGDRLSPSVLRQFAGWDLFLSDYFWAPVRRYWFAVAPGVLALAAFLIGLTVYLLRHRHARWAPGRGALALLVVSLAWIGMASQPLKLYLLEPVEVLFARELFGIDAEQFSQTEERDAVQALRAFVGKPDGTRWLDDRYPLVHGPVAPVPARASPDAPDLFLIVVESMRGQSMPWANPGGTDLVDMPRLQALAERSVVFPHFLSNGFPSAVGYISLSQSAWPHLRKRIAHEHTHIAMDDLARRLGTFGYRTLHVEAHATFDKQRHWLHAYERHSGTGGHAPTERHLVDQTIRILDDWDRAPDRRPVLTVFITHNPHLPYETPDDATDRLRHGPSLPDNYRSGMRYVDHHLGRLLDHLARRDRADRTVVLITGDHANFLDQSRSTGMPVNDTVWTSAMIHGPAALVGPPRTVRDVTSQIDVAPTFLVLAGDRRASAALGRNLLALGQRQANGVLAVRSGGLRWERGDSGFMLDPRLPAGASPSEGFASPPPATGASPPAPGEIMTHARLWSYLLDHDRVWHPAFLTGATPARGDIP